MAKIILITGATAGFGKAIAEKFAKEGWNCIITGRRKEKLFHLSEELSQKFKVSILPLVFDVTSKEEVFSTINKLDASWLPIDVLVNNAGLALGRDSFEDAIIEDWETMIQTNINGLLYVSKAVLPNMIQRSEGHIVNLGSIAGKEVYKNGNVYCATKSAVNAISDSMRIDLLNHKIRVTAIHPGAADTEFSSIRFKGDEDKAKQIYEGYTPLHAEDIADIVYYCVNLPKHVCINDLVVTCTAQANATLFLKE